MEKTYKAEVVLDYILRNTKNEDYVYLSASSQSKESLENFIKDIKDRIVTITLSEESVINKGKYSFQDKDF